MEGKKTKTSSSMVTSGFQCVPVGRHEPCALGLLVVFHSGAHGQRRPTLRTHCHARAMLETTYQRFPVLLSLGIVDGKLSGVGMSFGSPLVGWFLIFGEKPAVNQWWKDMRLTP